MNAPTVATPAAAHARRIPSLDGFRAISILMVYFSHAEVSAGFPTWLSRYVPFEFGMLGVRVFFVISGFLITTLLLKEEATRGAISLAAFYKRRVFRILPAYYFYLLAVFLLSQFVPPMRCPPTAYLTAATFTTGLAGNWGLAVWRLDTWPLSHGWSLAVEEQFYIFWPALLILVPPGRGLRRFVVGFIIGATLLMRILFPRNEFIFHVMTDHLLLAEADLIMFGCLLALVFQINRAGLVRLFSFYPVRVRAVAVGTIIFAACLPVIFAVKLHYPMVAISVSIQAAAITYLIGSYISVPTGVTYRLLNHPFLVWVGVLSYSLYLWQQPFLVPRDIYPLYWWQSFPQNLVPALVCGLLSYHFIEKPFLTIKDRFSRLAAPEKIVPLPSAS
jgi:peptidoglycan/LPS O-acetylase OafA/YrhL